MVSEVSEQSKKMLRTSCLIILSLFCLTPCFTQEYYYFWMNLQQINSTFYDKQLNLIPLTPILNNSVPLSTVQPSLIFFEIIRPITPGYKKLPAVHFTNNNSAVIDAVLCEESFTNGPNNGCLCEWVRAGNFCYKFQKTVQKFAAANCSNGSLASNFDNIFYYWDDIRPVHPQSCPFGTLNMWDESASSLHNNLDMCIGPPKPQKTWQLAEKQCKSSVDNHLPSFNKIFNFTILKSFYAKMCGSGPNIWLGYNWYAWTPNNKVASSAAYTASVLDTSTTTFNQSEQCFLYDVANGTYTTSSCSNKNTFSCIFNAAAQRCLPGWRYISAYCFKLLNSTYTFTDGVTQCGIESPNATVASFHSIQEWNDFNHYRTAEVNLREVNNAETFKDIYVGYTSDTNADWTNYDSSEDSWPNWPTHQPDKEKCAVSFYANDYLWNSTDCTTPRGVVCKGTVINSCRDLTYVDIDGECYKYMNTPVRTWSEAARLCNADGATLTHFGPYIFTQSVNKLDPTPIGRWAYLQNWRSALTAPTDNIWIGLTQYASVGQHKFMSVFLPNPPQSDRLYEEDHQFWINGGAYYSTLPYVISMKQNNFSWSLADENVTAQVVCQLQKPVVDNRNIPYCPSVDWYAVWNNFYHAFDCYIPLNDIASYTDAENLCQQLHNRSHLMTQPTEQDWNDYQDMHHIFLAMKYPLTSTWTGYARGPRQQNNIWISSLFGVGDANDIMFAVGRPNASATDGQNYCLSISSTGEYSDELCTETRGIVCKLSNLTNPCPNNSWHMSDRSGSTICYWISDVQLNFTAAQATCTFLFRNGSLPSFHSQAEYDDFLRLRWTFDNLDDPLNSTVWIGIQNAGWLPSPWAWSDASNYNWSQWFANVEPKFNPANKCAYSLNNYTLRDSMPWVEEDCNAVHGFICQYRLTPLINPCPRGYSFIYNKCVAVFTNHSCNGPEHSICCPNGTSLPSFTTETSWLSFLNWTQNMNSARHWSSPTTEIGWPITEYWIGLTQFPAASFYWDDASVFKYLVGVPPAPYTNSCYSSNCSTANCTWNKWAFVNMHCPQITLPSLICQIANLTCPYGFLLYYNNFCYKFVENVSIDVNGARSMCSSMGADLPSFHTDIEWNDFLSVLSINVDAGKLSVNKSVWIGLNDINKSLEFQWTNGMNYNWARWNPAVEPSDDIAKNSVAASNLSGTRFWTRALSTDNLSVVCQIRIKRSSICGSGWSDVSGRSCYKIIPNVQNLTKDQASVYCKSLNGFLPIFANQLAWTKFLDWKNNFASAKDLNTSDYWIGVNSYDSASDAWQWDDKSITNNSMWNGKLTPAASLGPYCIRSAPSPQNNLTRMDCDTSFATSLICKESITTNVSNWIEINGVKYTTLEPTFPNTTMSGAINECQARGGSLPVIQSNREWHDFVTYLWFVEFKYSLNINDGVWLGLSDQSSSLKWKWNDNSNYNYSQWQPSVEPSSNISSNCVVAFKNKNGQIFWRRQTCLTPAAVVCVQRTPTVSSCSIGWSDVNGDGICYQIFPKSKNLTYVQAQLYCSAMNGVLPCFSKTADWSNFLSWKYNFGAAKDLNTTDIFLGINSYNSVMQQWTCADGTTNNYTFWSTGNSPNINSDTYCILSKEAENPTDSWTSESCTNIRVNSLICKQNTNKTGSIWINLAGIKYATLFNNSILSASSAQLACEGVNGSLPSFHTNTEWNTFLDYIWLSQNFYNKDVSSGIWIGLTDKTHPFLWRWMDNSSYNWTNWDVGLQPTRNTKYSCVYTVQNETGSTYVWRRQNCSTQRFFVCQQRPNVPTICPLGWSEISNKCYRIWLGLYNLKQSQMNSFCILNGGSLPVFHSNQTYTLVLNWKNNLARTRNYGTIGGFWLSSLQLQKSQWIWQDRSVKDFDLFSSPSTLTGNITCIAAMLNLSYAWIDFDCQSSLLHDVLCEYTALANSTKCAYPWIEINGMCYLPGNSNLSESNAVTTCTNKSTITGVGNLPSFHSYQEWDDFSVIRYYFDALRNPDNNIDSPECLVGVEGVNSNAIFIYNDSSNFNWVNWKNGTEPNNDPSKSCVESESLKVAFGSWKMTSCLDSSGFICQNRIVPLINPCQIPGWSSIGNKCYKILPSTKADFSTAQTACSSVNATLPTFESLTQWQQFLSWKDNFNLGKNSYTSDFWLGLTISNTQLSWDDNTNFSFNNFANGQPMWTGQCFASNYTMNFQWAETACASLILNTICQMIQYPRDCKMSEWRNSSCTATCGSATLISTRYIMETNLNNGTPCPADIAKSFACDQNPPCSKDCLVTEWSSWSKCNCSAMEIYRERGITQLHFYKGLPCPETFETYNCTIGSCTISRVLTLAEIPEALSDHISLATSIQEAIPYLTARLNDSEKMEIGYQFDDIISNCTFAGKQCGEQHFKRSYDQTYGNCYTFNFEMYPRTVNEAGIPYGLHLLLKTQQTSYLCSSESAGLKVVIHDNNSTVFADSEGYKVPPGTDNSIGIIRKKIQKAAGIYSSCISNVSKTDDSDNTYSVEGCYRNCFQNIVSNSCGCADPRYNLLKNQNYCWLDNKICLDFVRSCEAELTVEKCGCYPPCNEVNYKSYLTKSKFNLDFYKDIYCTSNQSDSLCRNYMEENFALLQIFYDSLMSVNYVEAPGYSVLAFLTDFSNVSGIFLGFCVITIIELALIFLYAIAVCMKSIL